jgi:hypothetical protein
MILDGKDKDIEILMTQLELEIDANNVALRCRIYLMHNGFM